MASAWESSWGSSWGVSWGAVSAAVAVTTAGSSYQYAPKTKQRLAREHKLEEERKKRLRARTVRTLTGRGLLSPDSGTAALEAVDAALGQEFELQENVEAQRAFEARLMARLIELVLRLQAEEDEMLLVLMAAA